MPNPIRLSDAEVRSRSAAFPDWTVENDALHRTFTFADFVEAFTFMTAVALLAERMGHHPDWSNVYRMVRIRLSTHDVGGISEKDFAMAEEISKLYRRAT
jgi:4a-hydroxytetrahydrobiopterin dehydratase